MSNNEVPSEFEPDPTLQHVVAPDSDEATLAINAGQSFYRSSTDPHGQIFGDYQILREIARGGMGVVYQAKQISLNRIVALKMILTGQLASDDDVKRFYLEAESAAGLDHSGIVPIYEIGSHQGQHFFSMGYVDGPSLAHVLKDGPLPPKAAAECLARVCDAIQYAHDRGLIHRDLKPGNILLASESSTHGKASAHGMNSVRVQSASNPKEATTQNDTDTITKKTKNIFLSSSDSFATRASQLNFAYLPKVTDFGLAKQIHGNSDLTGTGQVLGTPSYMPPEQADGRVANVGPLSDVYSLGAILYCMLTGRPPFQSANPIDTIIQVIKEPPISPRQLNPSVPRDLETICLKAIEKVPSKRYSSAGEMQAELLRFLAGEPIEARPISAMERGGRWLWRHPTIAITGLVVLAAITSVLGTIYSSNQKLKNERDVAVQATKEAKTQRDLAEKRLDKAIEAVDQMMVRTAGERWASRPELQEERQKVLEDAVAFYGTFGDENKQDARVQVEAAKAQMRVSEAYLLLNNLDAAVQAAEKSNAIYRSLSSESPKIASYYFSASEAASMIADICALSGKYPLASIRYSEAVDLAKTAGAMEAGNRDFQIRLVEAQSNHVYFLLATEPEAGRKALDGLMELARKLNVQSTGGFVERLAFGFSLAVEGAYALSKNEIPRASKCYEEAWQTLEVIKDLPPPTTRKASQFKYTRGIVAVQRGLALCLRGQTDEEKEIGLLQMQSGIEMFDQLLLVNPKAIPYRLQKIQSFRARANLYRFLKNEDKAKEDETLAFTLLGEVSRDNASLDWVTGFEAMQQSIAWVREIRLGNLDNIESTAEKFLQTAKPSIKADVKYNVACAFALASSLSSEKKEEYALRAIAILNELVAADYFKQKERFENLRRDTDLQSLHDRADFRAFVKSIGK